MICCKYSRPEVSRWSWGLRAPLHSSLCLLLWRKLLTPLSVSPRSMLAISSPESDKKYQISLGIPSPDCSLTWTLSWTDVQLGVGVDAVHARVVSPRVLVLVLVLVWVWAANTGVITVLDGPIFLFWYFACNIQIRLCGSLQLWVYLSKIVNDNYHIIMLSTSVKNPNLSEIKSFITTSCCCRPTYIPTAPPAS